MLLSLLLLLLTMLPMTMRMLLEWCTTCLRPTKPVDRSKLRLWGEHDGKPFWSEVEGLGVPSWGVWKGSWRRWMMRTFQLKAEVLQKTVLSSGCERLSYGCGTHVLILSWFFLLLKWRAVAGTKQEMLGSDALVPRRQSFVRNELNGTGI